MQVNDSGQRISLNQSNSIPTYAHRCIRCDTIFTRRMWHWCLRLFCQRLEGYEERWRKNGEIARKYTHVKNDGRNLTHEPVIAALQIGCRCVENVVGDSFIGSTTHATEKMSKTADGHRLRLLFRRPDIWRVRLNLIQYDITISQGDTRIYPDDWCCRCSARLVFISSEIVHIGNSSFFLLLSW